MIFNVVFIQALLSTVLAAPLYAREDNSLWINGENGDARLIANADELRIAPNLVAKFAVVKREDGSEVAIENSAIEGKQNLCFCPTDCIGSCCPCGGCPEKNTCKCPRPCDVCNLVDCLCPSKWLPCSGCGKPDCNNECEPCVPEPPCEPEPECEPDCCPKCLLPECCCPKPCDACGLADCLCPSKWPCPKCLLPDCLCGKEDPCVPEPPCEPEPEPAC